MSPPSSKSSDARYWVINPSEDRVGDTSYFNEILEEMENGGREAFAHHLLNMDVSDFVAAARRAKEQRRQARDDQANDQPLRCAQMDGGVLRHRPVIGHSTLDTYGRKTVCGMHGRRD